MLTRRKPLRSGKGLRTTAKLRRSKRVQPVNRKRKPKRYARDFGEEAARVRAMPCLITGQVPSDPAHVTSRGAGGGRFDLVPLCTVMHLQQHSVGIESFQGCHGLDLRAEADRIAVEHPEPLGIRGLARRWAVHLGDIDMLCTSCGVCPHRYRPSPEAGPHWRCSECGGITEPHRALAEPLDDYEREALLGWVRRRMEREAERRKLVCWNCHGDGTDGEPECGTMPAWRGPCDVCKASGRLTAEQAERRKAAFDGLAHNDREALAHDVMAALGWETLGSDPAGEHGLASTLCEEAGWPS